MQTNLATSSVGGKQNTKEMWLYVLFSLLSLIPLGWAWQLVGELVLARRLARTGIEVAGKIVGKRRIRGTDNFDYYASIFRFTTLAGQHVEAESAGHPTGAGYHKGTDVRVLYDSDQPTRFLLVHELGSGSRYARLVIAGLMLAALWWPLWWPRAWRH